MKEKTEYECRAHSKTRLRYHVIFSTKYRRKCLAPIREQVLQAFKDCEENSDFKILCMELDDDHIHLLMKWKPDLSISQVVRRLKQVTNFNLWRSNEAYLKKFYWKNRQLWTGGYFCSTIGEVSEKSLKKYIENQG